MVNMKNSIKIILSKTRFKCFEYSASKWFNFYLRLDLNVLNTENDLIFFIFLDRIQFSVFLSRFIRGKKITCPGARDKLNFRQDKHIFYTQCPVGK